METNQTTNRDHVDRLVRIMREASENDELTIGDAWRLLGEAADHFEKLADVIKQTEKWQQQIDQLRMELDNERILVSEGKAAIVDLCNSVDALWQERWTFVHALENISRSSTGAPAEIALSALKKSGIID